MLIGISTKTGILLVDYANTLHSRGRSKLDAMLESAHTRFRPIVMTSFSVMIGNLPLALALEPGSGSRASLGIVVIGGVFSSLVLTLLLVPIVYEWLAPKNTPNQDGDGDADDDSVADRLAFENGTGHPGARGREAAATRETSRPERRLRRPCGARPRRAFRFRCARVRDSNRNRSRRTRRSS